MYTQIKNCLCCNNSELVSALDLNAQPLANSYLKFKNDDEEVFPLGINFCVKCTHIQLTNAVDPDKLFKNYLYVSGTTKTLKEYFDWFVDFCSNYFRSFSNKNILDIACNDGSQLNSFKKRGHNTFGIDPAENLYHISSVEHNVICDYLTEKSIKKFNENFDIIIAQNVFAHNTYPKQFLEICKNYLSENGRIFIQTSQSDMILNNQFDTIYHEHISFFSVKSLSTLAKSVGLNIIDVIRTPIHGTSFIFVLSKDGKDRSEELLKSETELNLDIIKKYSENCYNISKNTSIKINELKKDGYKIIGYGAAAKGNTFLNFSKINLDYIVDDNELKQGLYSPGSKIPIFSPDKLSSETGKICVVPLSWNFFDEIQEKVKKKNLTFCIFLKYFPYLEIL
jgi:2-polyprenyl-3-methyl-5-hydroxy-6-metoxy-1,4-benzoquinol methylase